MGPEIDAAIKRNDHQFFIDLVHDPFKAWLSACAAVALRDKWQIDPEWPRWVELYNRRYSAEEAVQAFLKEGHRP